MSIAGKFFNVLKLCFVLQTVMLLSCNKGPKVYESTCDEGQVFIKVSFAHLMDSLSFYDHKYIETTGIYHEGKERSALVSIELTDKRAFWVNFSQDCELYLRGTHTGFFETSNGGYLKIDNKKMRIRGKIDVSNKGHLKLYKGCIDHISLVEL